MPRNPATTSSPLTVSSANAHRAALRLEQQIEQLNRDLKKWASDTIKQFWRDVAEFGEREARCMLRDEHNLVYKRAYHVEERLMPYNPKLPVKGAPVQGETLTDGLRLVRQRGKTAPMPVKRTRRTRVN